MGLSFDGNMVYCGFWNYWQNDHDCLEHLDHQTSRKNNVDRNFSYGSDKLYHND